MYGIIWKSELIISLKGELWIIAVSIGEQYWVSQIIIDCNNSYIYQNQEGYFDFNQTEWLFDRFHFWIIKRKMKKTIIILVRPHGKFV